MAQPAGPSSSLPRDAKLVISVLESMGVEEYEPRVLTGLLEYMHRYCAEVFTASADYATHAGRDALDAQDVHLATKLKAAASATTATALIERMARERNRMPLPPPPPDAKLQLPAEKNCLLTPNFQMLTRPPDPPEESGVRSQPVAGGGGGGGSAPKAGAKTIAINLSKPDVEMGEAS